MGKRAILVVLALSAAAGCGDSSDGAPMGSGGQEAGAGGGPGSAGAAGVGSAGMALRDSGATFETSMTADATNESTRSDASGDASSDAAVGPIEGIHFYGRWRLLPLAATTVNSGSHL